MTRLILQGPLVAALVGGGAAYLLDSGHAIAAAFAAFGAWSIAESIVRFSRGVAHRRLPLAQLLVGIGTITTGAQRYDPTLGMGPIAFMATTAGLVAVGYLLEETSHSADQDLQQPSPKDSD